MGFTWKVFVGTLLVVLVTTVLLERQVGTMLAERRMASIQQRIVDDAMVTSSALRDAMASGDVARLRELVRGMGEHLEDRRLTVIAADGKVLADTHEDPALMERHADRPEIKAPGTFQERYSTTLSREMMYYAVPLESGGRKLGSLRVALSMDDIGRDVDDVRSAFRTGALMALGVGLVLAVVFARRIARPLRDITDFVAAVGQGEYGRRIAITTHDELGSLAGALNDMTDQLVGRALRIAAEVSQKSAILAAMDEGVLAVDAEEHVVLANDAAVSLLNADPSIPGGRRLAELTRAPEILELAESCLHDGRRAQAELSVPGPRGGRILQVTAGPVRDDDGEMAMVVFVLHDLTEVRRLEKVRRDFVANVSHELKTPLTSMRGFLEAVVDDPDMPKETRVKFLDKVSQGTARLGSIVADLLELARIEAEQGRFLREPLFLDDLAMACVARNQAEAEMRRVRLVRHDPPVPVAVRGDERALVTAINNLLTNAIKYSPEGGHVDVRTSADERGAWIAVSDDGPGIAKHEQERIFERFYRVDKDRSRALGGTGLGLSIVKNVVLGHGGEVSVESELGRGSTFRIRLPRAPRDEGEAPGGVAPAGDDAGSSGGSEPGDDGAGGGSDSRGADDGASGGHPEAS
ncbi:MAG: HAMP domain-containing protein [Planctomycetes bacterium]|nr:HAMP domain-containing protein [Planctomycetota bacterium]